MLFRYRKIVQNFVIQRFLFLCFKCQLQSSSVKHSVTFNPSVKQKIRYKFIPAKIEGTLKTEMQSYKKKYTNDTLQYTINLIPSNLHNLGFISVHYDLTSNSPARVRARKPLYGGFARFFKSSLSIFKPERATPMILKPT